MQADDIAMKSEMSIPGSREAAGLSETESAMKPISRKRLFAALATMLTFGLFSACGGELKVADGGIRGTGSSVGPVSGFGSVFVNGVEFRTDGNVVSDDGIKSESQLVEGMILRVEGEWRSDYTGNAEVVEYDDSLRGELTVVSAWNAVTRTAEISILGQTVRIDAQTVVKGKMVEQLTNGDFVRMSGWRMPGGGFRASYLGLSTSNNSSDFDDFNGAELEGEISYLNTAQKTFSIGTQVVSYGSAEYIGVKETDLADTVTIEVEGNLSSDGSILLANKIEPDDFRRYSQSTDTDTEFVGPVTSSFDGGSGTFTINGLTVEVTSDTRFDDGVQSGSDLVQGLLIQVEGHFVAGGIVKADEISQREANAEVQGGKTSSIDHERRQLFVGGVLVQLTPLTIITDDDGEQRLTLLDLETNFALEVDGIERLNSEGTAFLEALKIEQDDDTPSNEFELTGHVSAMSNDDIQVLGVDMRINSSTKFDGTSRAELQAMVMDDTVKPPRVEVVYEELSGFYIVKEIDLEESD